MVLQFSQYQHQSTPVPSTDKVCSALRYINRSSWSPTWIHWSLEAFHMRCELRILDVCWWAHVSNAEVLQWSGLSTIGDILRHRRLSLFGHVPRLHAGVPVHDTLRLTVDTHEDRKPMASFRRPPASQRLAQQGSGGCQRSTAIYAVEIWDRQGSRSGATIHSDYATTTTTTTTMMMKDVRLVSKMEGNANFSIIYTVQNRDCWVFENHWRMM